MKQREQRPAAAIFIDATYLDQTGKGLSQFFSNNVLGRLLPAADFGIFINSLAFQMGLDLKPNSDAQIINVYLICKSKNDKFTFCTPSDIANDIQDQCYTDTMGKFIFCVLPTLGYDSNCNAALDLAEIVCRKDHFPVAALVLDLNECQAESIEKLAHSPGTRFISFSMRPQDKENFPAFQHEELGHSLLNALGVTPEELRK